MRKISVCLATYNGAKFIKIQVESILLQLTNNDELIVSDNGSTDGTLEILKSFNDERIKIYSFLERRKLFLSNSSHYTISANFENALKRANGNYIFLSDQDDVWLPNKIELSLLGLKNADLVVSNCSIISEDGVTLDKQYLKLSYFSKGVFTNVLSPRFHGCCMAFKALALDYILPFPKLLVLHDSWIGVLISQVGVVKYLDQDLMLYRIHGSNSSNNNGLSKNGFLFKVVYRVMLYFQLLVRMLKIKLKLK